MMGYLQYFTKCEQAIMFSNMLYSILHKLRTTRQNDIQAKFLCYTSELDDMRLVTLLIDLSFIIGDVEVICDSLFVQVFLGLKLMKMNRNR